MVMVRVRVKFMVSVKVRVRVRDTDHIKSPSLTGQTADHAGYKCMDWLSISAQGRWFLPALNKKGGIKCTMQA